MYYVTYAAQPDWSTNIPVGTIEQEWNRPFTGLFIPQRMIWEQD